jgi:hypothetical protein
MRTWTSYDNIQPLMNDQTSLGLCKVKLEEATNDYNFYTTEIKKIKN